MVNCGVTLRAVTNDRMERLMAKAQALVSEARGDLKVQLHWHDVFRAVINNADAVQIARDVAQALGHETHEMTAPMPWSEDFGRFADDGASAAMLYVGSGVNQPQLHNPDYDFPDALLPVVIDQFCAIVDWLTLRR